jgi:superfamily II DNA or RNA helicase
MSSHTKRLLSDRERLQLHQLRLLEWAEQRQDAGSEAGAPGPGTQRRRSSANAVRLSASAPAAPVRKAEHWSLLGEMELRPWQEEAAAAWFSAGRRGTIKVVTGAGKTVLALGIAERLQQEDPELRVAVVVPSIVLMNQWHAALRRQSNLDPRLIGRLGGGFDDDFASGCRVLIAVLASARKSLPRLVRAAGVSAHLLLVVDESHRAGAPQMSQVLDTDRAYTLALSATPERDEPNEDQATIGGELGRIVFDMSFADAIARGVLPPFEIHHFGLPLNPSEAQRYQALTRAITDTRRELAAISPAARKAGGGEGLLTWARKVASRPSGNIAAVAARYVNDTTRRKQLLYRAEARIEAATLLVREALEDTPQARVILFHESIDEVVELYTRMRRARLPVVMENSELAPDMREQSLALFRDGTAKVIVSARSLIEGFNVPEADLGIVVASSSSPRQRIQSIGRVLRKHHDASGAQKAARVCVLYVRDSVDEAIYEKQDWNKLIGLGRNRYFHWNPPADPVEQDMPPKAAIPGEAEIDTAALRPGDRYPGRYQGAEFTTDRHGNVLDLDGRVASNPQELPALVARFRGGPGRFRVTPRDQAILVRVPTGELHELVDRGSRLFELPEEQLPLRLPEEEWITVFLGTLPEPFAFSTTIAEPGAGATSAETDGLSPGDPYPGPNEPALELRFRQRGGGTVARRVRGGELYASGRGAEELIDALRELGRREGPVSRFWVNDHGHAFWRKAGQARFIASLSEPLAFPGANEGEIDR